MFQANIFFSKERFSLFFGDQGCPSGFAAAAVSLCTLPFACPPCGENPVGVIMAGMGEDWSKEMLKMKEAGAKNIAPNKKYFCSFWHAKWCDKAQLG